MIGLTVKKNSFTGENRQRRTAASVKRIAESDIMFVTRSRLFGAKVSNLVLIE